MARLARAEVFASDEVAIVHVLNRTVRRCFLLGDDPVTGRNYDQRKAWIDELLIHQAEFFGIDLLCQAILSNHFHLVLRSRPDVVATWDDTEVARRWLMLCPLRRKENRQPEEPTEFELNTIRLDKERLAEIRSRLSDISWWMRLLCQQIAQRANRDDKEVGKFWQARYRAVRILDETALLASAAYVDLNPIRAALAETIEDSDYTSAQKRCRDLQVQRSEQPVTTTSGPLAGGSELGGEQSGGPEAGSSEASAETTDTRDAHSRHLAPVDLQERTAPTGPDVHTEGYRCSNRGFLPMSAAEYLQLLDWTARQDRPGKTGATPQHLPPLFERLGINAEIWCTLVRDFGRLFSVVAGKPQRIDEHRSRLKNCEHRYRARRQARELMASM